MESNNIESNKIQYRNLALTFINNNKNNLIKIYTQNFTNSLEDEKDAILLIDLSKIHEQQNNINVAYLPVKYLEAEIALKIEDRKKENNDNIIYFLLVTPLEQQIIEIDIRSLL